MYTHAQIHSNETNSLYKLGNTFVDTTPKKFRNWRGCSTVSPAFHKIMNDSKILFPEGTDSVVHKPLPHVSLTSHWHGPKRFVNPQPRIILVIYNVRCSVEKKLATLMQGTLVYTKHVRLFLFLFCRWRVVGCFLLNFWHIALFLSFFLSTIRSRLRLLVRMDSPDASAVRRVASETDSHRWVPAEPHPGA